MDHSAFASFTFTRQEQRVIDYLKKHPYAIANHSAEQLAKLTWTSAATLNRLGHKLGYKGFADFKLHSVVELQNRPVSVSDFLENFAECDPESETFITELNRVICLKNHHLLQSMPTVLKQCITMLQQAQCLDLYATGNNLAYAQIAARKLIHAGKKTNVFHYVEDEHLNDLQPSTLSLILSRTGSNPLCLYAARKLGELGLNVVAITGDSCSPLSAHCTLTLPFWYPQQEHPLARMIEADSLSYLFNKLCFALLKNQNSAKKNP